MGDIEPIRRIPWPPPDATTPETIVLREWLVTNGLGGYASGTVAGAITRRYHGLLVAALSAPLGRTVMLSHVASQLRWPDGGRTDIGGRERSGDAPDAKGTGYLTEFRLDAGLPVWRYEVEQCVIEKRLFLPHRQNTVVLVYQLLAGASRVELVLRPSVNFRPQELPVSEPLGAPYELRAVGDQYEITLAESLFPPLRMTSSAAESTFTLDGLRFDTVLYPVEENRGYQARGVLWSPGYFTCALEAARPATLIASTEAPETFRVLDPAGLLGAERMRRRRLIAQATPEARSGVAAELVLAADQFIITPASRHDETARAHAYGDDVRTIIAGYHWFTDWGRDTMISLEGLALVTGRHTEAGYILRTFSHYERDGLIPNLFPEGQTEGLYHTADATLWFFHAVHRYLVASGDRLTLALLYPTLERIIDAHVRGTRFGIGVDARDGLLRQGAPGYQLTWMDAKLDDWVVTPRRGKAVEVNALWFNALKLMELWAHELCPGRAHEYADRSEQARSAFNARFWSPRAGHLCDVVDAETGFDDETCRPNQILAIALPYAVLARERWEPVLEVVRRQLLTPVGLRTLAPAAPDYKPRYFGDLRARDAAYHQGTVWAWLVGPFVDAWLKVYPDDLDGARAAVAGFLPHLDDACVGTISEVFDAEAPYTPRGCVAQAWSVAEVLRAWIKIARRGEQRPPGGAGFLGSDFSLQTP